MPLLAPRGGPPPPPPPPGLDPDLLNVGANVYTYVGTDLITGEILADHIPLTVQSFSRQINSAGTLSGSLSLQVNDQVNQPYLEALEATRAVLWVLQNGFPVWSGIVWDWPHNTVMPPAVLPFEAQTLESLFDHRMITDTLVYNTIDLFDVFNDLVRYGTSKNSPFIDPKSPAFTRLPAAATDAMRVAGLVIPAVSAGTGWTATYAYSDLRKVSDVWSDLIAGGDFEYTFEPGLDGNGNLVNTVRLGYLSLDDGDDPDVDPVYFFPGNVIDYGYQRTGSQSANAIWATAPPNGNGATWQAAYPHGFDLAALAAGYPLLEDTVTWNGSTVTSQGQVNQFADTQVQLRTQQMTLPQLVVGGAGQPPLPEIKIGDEATFTAASALHPAANGQPGLQMQIRVAGWQCVPPGDNQVEQLTISTSGAFVERRS